MRAVTEKKRPTKAPAKVFSGVFNFRPGSELHERLSRLADDERRSLNDQVIVLLEEALAARKPKR